VEDALAAQITGVHAHIVPQLFSSKYDLDFTLAVQRGHKKVAGHFAYLKN
jgi:hypothetical protein